MRNSTRIAGIAGICWATPNELLGFSTGQPPELDSSGREVANFLADGRGAYLAAVAVFGATLPLLFVFAGELFRRAAKRVDDERVGIASSLINPALATLVIGTSLAYLALLPFIYGDGLGNDATDGMLRYAYVLTFVATMIGNIGGAVLIAAASTTQCPAARTTSRVVAALVGICCVAGLVNPTAAMFGGLGFLGIALWVIAVGLGMTRRRVDAAHAVPMSAATA